MLNICVQLYARDPKVDVQDTVFLHNRVRTGPAREGLGRDDRDAGLVPGVRLSDWILSCIYQEMPCFCLDSATSVRWLMEW